LPTAERWLHGGQEGKPRRVSPMAQITASRETGTSKPVLLSSRSGSLPIADEEQVNMRRATEPEL